MEVYTWDDIEAALMQTPFDRPYSVHNAALKYFRHLGEDPVGVPTSWRGVEIPLEPMTMDIGTVIHAPKGPDFTVDADTMQPWSWRAMLTQMKNSKKEEVNAGGGVVGLWCAPIRDTCDHNRASNCRQLKGKRNPIWDFVLLLHDGSWYSLHPNHNDRGPYDPDEPLRIGLSDGPGTYKYVTQGAYTQQERAKAPAVAGGVAPVAAAAPGTGVAPSSVSPKKPPPTAPKSSSESPKKPAPTAPTSSSYYPASACAPAAGAAPKPKAWFAVLGSSSAATTSKAAATPAKAAAGAGSWSSALVVAGPSSTAGASSSAPVGAGGVPLSKDGNTGQYVPCTAPAVVDGSFVAVDPRSANSGLSRNARNFAKLVERHTLIWDCTPPQLIDGVLFWWHPTHQVWLFREDDIGTWYVLE